MIILYYELIYSILDDVKVWVVGILWLFDSYLKNGEDKEVLPSFLYVFNKIWSLLYFKISLNLTLDLYLSKINYIIRM